MYVYNFRLTFSKRRTNLDFVSCKQMIAEAIEAINRGLTFKRDGKILSIIKLKRDELELSLSANNSLANPNRSMSALTRYLTTYYVAVFEGSMYNKTLFNIELISQEQVVLPSESPRDLAKMSNEELLKAIVDLLYGYTATSRAEEVARKQTIQEIKSLVYPYMKGC